MSIAALQPSCFALACLLEKSHQGAPYKPGSVQDIPVGWPMISWRVRGGEGGRKAMSPKIPGTQNHFFAMIHNDYIVTSL